MSSEKVVAYVVIIIAILLLILLYFKTWIRCVLLACKLRGPAAVPILGNVFLINDFARLINIGNTCYKLYGSIFRAWISVIPVIFVLEPKDIQVILGSSRHTDKNFIYTLMHNFIGEGLISNSGEKWKLHRKLIQPYFQINILELYTKSFWQSTNRQIEKLRGVKDVNINTFVNDCVLDVLHETILGIEPHETALKSESPFRKGQITLAVRIQKPWYLLDNLYRFTVLAEKELKQKSKLYEYTKKILLQKRANRNTRQSSISLIQYFIEIAENNPIFDDDRLINELCTFMLAGQDSVAAAVSFTLYNLASNPSIQDKVHHELEGIFNNADRQVDANDLKNMRYLEQCVKESLRLYPSVPMMARKLTEEVVLGKYTLPANCQVFIAPYATHRLEHVFENPMEYNPDRFLPENLEKQHPCAFIPFSFGPRNCIGYKFALMELKVILSVILRNYRISLCPYKKMTLAYRITLRASGGVWLRLEPRK